MSNLRFVVLAVAVFAATFAGLSWVSKSRSGATIARVAPVRMDSPVSPIDKSSKQPGDRNAGRNQLRMTAIQTANAYALSPCDEAAKAAFIVAASTYIRVTSDSFDKAPDDGTAQDARVREAIQAAFNAGGVTKNEFPTGTQSWVSAISPSHSPAPCTIGRRAENG